MWPLQLGLGTRKPRFVAWSLELGLGTLNPRFQDHKCRVINMAGPPYTVSGHLVITNGHVCFVGNTKMTIAVALADVVSVCQAVTLPTVSPHQPPCVLLLPRPDVIPTAIAVYARPERSLHVFAEVANCGDCLNVLDHCWRAVLGKVSPSVGPPAIGSLFSVGLAPAVACDSLPRAGSGVVSHRLLRMSSGPLTIGMAGQPDTHSTPNHSPMHRLRLERSCVGGLTSSFQGNLTGMAGERREEAAQAISGRPRDVPSRVPQEPCCLSALPDNPLNSAPMFPC